MFWLMKVVQAEPKAFTGMKAKPSSLTKAPLPAMAAEPKTLTLDCTITFAKAMTEFCTPEGRPMRSISFSSGLSRQRPLMLTRQAPWARDSRKKASPADSPWAMTVASAAPRTPMFMGPTKRISSTTLVTEEMIR